MGASSECDISADQDVVGAARTMVYWRVSASPVSEETATFTVNRITAQEQLGAYEPLNVTRELGVKVGIHF